ncbi:GNAT family N-acetyltransferase, partial [Roseovarius tolerans]
NLVLRALRRGDLSGSIQTIWRIGRDRITGQYRLLFCMSGDKARQVDLGTRKLTVLRFDDWSDFDTKSLDFLEANHDKIQWDVRKHLKEGMSVWVGSFDGAPATIAQTRPGQNVRLYFFPMTERCALISHCFTAPEQRGQGFYVAILKYVCRSLGEKGFSRIYIDCSDSNLSSERGILTAGFLRIGRAIHKRNGTTVWYQETPPSVTKLEEQSNAK